MVGWNPSETTPILLRQLRSRPPERSNDERSRGVEGPSGPHLHDLEIRGSSMPNGFPAYPASGRGDTYSGGQMSFGPPPGVPGVPGGVLGDPMSSVKLGTGREVAAPHRATMRFSFTTPLAALSASFMTWYLMDQNAEHTGAVVASSASSFLSDVVPARVKPRDEFQELYVAGGRAVLILQDLAIFLASEAFERLLPETVQSRLAELRPELRPLQELIPQEGPVAEALEAARSFGSECIEELRPHMEALKMNLRQMASKLEEAVQSFMDYFLQKYPQHKQSLAGPANQPPQVSE
eukprot:g15179.t1